MVLKKSTLMSSAMDEQDVGCPDPAAVVDSTEWMRSLVARSRRTCASSEDREGIFFFGGEVDGGEEKLEGEIMRVKKVPDILIDEGSAWSILVTF